jgi:hypothetical protein
MTETETATRRRAVNSQATEAQLVALFAGRVSPPRAEVGERSVLRLIAPTPDDAALMILNED